MNNKILYFGYGANRDPRMIAAITGRPESDLVGTPALLEGYELAVQRLDQIPDVIDSKSPNQVSPRDLIAECWDSDFTSYVISPNAECRVSGTIWELTTQERGLIRDWELIDFGWYEDCEGVAITADGREIFVMTEKLGPGQQVDHVVDGLNYETWLNNPARFEIIAEHDRKEHEKRIRNVEGSNRGSEHY